MTGRRGLLLFAGVALLGLALLWGLVAVGLLPSAQRGEAAGFGQLVLAAVALLSTAVGAAWRASAGHTEPDAEVLDGLARASKRLWTQAAAERGLLEPTPLHVQWRRTRLPVTGPATAAVAAAGTAARFPPLPGLREAQSTDLGGGGREQLFALYGGLPSGRLVILGPPGAGKSAAGILLVLDALRHREQLTEQERAKVPVPVLLSMQGWDPGEVPLETWVGERLATVHPPLAGRRGSATARRLFADGRLSLLLDGLDEVPGTLRPAVLRALNHAACRLVVLTRPGELVGLAARGHLLGAAALELRGLESSAAADYLRLWQVDPPPAGWSRFLEHLRHHPDGPVAQALSVPLFVTLVRDTYEGSSVQELLDAQRFPTRGDVEDHLLDRVVPMAYSNQAGKSGSSYPPDVARRALQTLARGLTPTTTREVGWWRLQDNLPAWPRRLSAAVVMAGLAAVAFGTCSGLSFVLRERPALVDEHGTLMSLQDGFVAGFLSVVVDPSFQVFAVLLGVLFAAVFDRGPRPPRRLGITWRSLRSRQAVVSGFWGFALTTPLAPFFAVAYSLSGGMAFSESLRVSLALWLALGGALWLSLWLGAVLAGPGDAAGSLTPRDSWRSSLSYGISYGWLVAGFSYFGLLLVQIGSDGWHSVTLADSIVFALPFGVVLGAAVGLVQSHALAAALACLQLRVTYGTPVRFLRFLDDARERHVLRSLGPLYQFRHGRLRDRLAAGDDQGARPSSEGSAR